MIETLLPASAGDFHDAILNMQFSTCNRQHVILITTKAWRGLEPREDALGRLAAELAGTRADSTYNGGMHQLRAYRNVSPSLGERVYIDPTASVIGDVVLGEDVSVWPFTVIRGDVNFIRVGARSNIQDGTVIHVSHDGPHAKRGGFATVIGADVTIGHKALVHACAIEDASLIGMGAIVLDGARVRRHGFLGAGAMLTSGKELGEGEMWLGSPAKFARKLSDAEIEALYYSAGHYVRLKDEYLAGNVQAASSP